MKNQVKARLFGLTMTFAALAMFVVPDILRRW
jgi:hypothetical protein